MTAPLSKTRPKNVLRKLGMLQDENIDLSPFEMLEIKHWLRSHCSQVTICQDSTSNPSLSSTSMPWKDLPLFLSSQLTSQGVANQSSTWEQLNPVLTFILPFLPSRSRQSRRVSKPVRFRYHCKDTHKTYYIFAYLCVKMPRSITYTSAELLSLRDKRLPEPPLDKIAHGEGVGKC
jgi:hypothetical protein